MFSISFSLKCKFLLQTLRGDCEIQRLFLFSAARHIRTCFLLVFIDAFNTTSRYLDDIFNIKNVSFDNMVSRIYPSEHQLNKAYTSNSKATFLDLYLSISNEIVSTKI